MDNLVGSALNKIRQTAGQLFGGAQQAVGNEIHQLPQQIGSLAGQAISPQNNIFFGNAPQLPNIPQVQIPQFHFQNPVANFGANLVGGLADSLANTGHNLIAQSNKNNADIGSGAIVQPKVLLGDLGATALPVLNIATLGGASVAADAIGQAAKQGIIQGAKTGALEGASYGGAYGLSQGLADNRNTKDNTQYIGNVAASTAQGAGVGTLLGAPLGAGSALVGKTVGAFKNAFPKASEQEQQAAAQLYQQARDQAGRYASKPVQTVQDWVRQETGKKPGSPVYQSDLQAAIQKNLGDQTGKIDFGALVGGKPKDTTVLPDKQNKIVSEEGGLSQTSPQESAYQQALVNKGQQILGSKEPVIPSNEFSSSSSIPPLVNPQTRPILLNEALNQERAGVGAFVPPTEAQKGVGSLVTPTNLTNTKIPTKASARNIQKEIDQAINDVSSKAKQEPGLPQQLLQAKEDRGQLPYTESRVNNPKGNPTNTHAQLLQKDIAQTEQYINEQVRKQNGSRSVEGGTIRQKVNSFLQDAKAKLVDSTAPIEDVLAQAQKQGKFQVLPTKDISPQIDRAIRSRELAGQFVKDNGLADVIKSVPNIDALNQYLIAKHAAEVATATGRNVSKDAQLVHTLAPVYEPYAQAVVKYGQTLLDKAVESGLVSQETATMLKQKYPNYVPLNRIFNELEKTRVPEGVGKGVASLSKQSIVQRLKGSERDIQNPIESLLGKTADVFSQGERNLAGKMLASYKDIPGNPFNLHELGKGETATHTISFLDNGVKRTFATTPEIEAAAKFLDKRQLGLIGQIFAAPVRIARVGITGINLPFIASNLAKDQVSAFINSRNSLRTSVANPAVFLKAAWSAIGHGKAYDEWIRTAGGGTSYDISRSAPHTSVAQIRAEKNAGSKIAYTVTHPQNLLRAVENVVSRGEELTRLQQFVGTRDALLKQGRTPEDANILAAQASRRNTTDFARSGDWGKALNSVFLYLNAGIQGGRTLVRSLQTNPAGTAAKLAISVFVPVAAVTAWNLSDPQRKAAYDDIQDFEKDNNLIIIPPNPVKDPKTGKWNVIKVPFSQEVANLTTPIRKGIESLQGYDTPSFGDFASAIIGSTTGLNMQSPNALVGQFVPQAVKPELEALLNKNLFTGQDIVPQYINGQASKNLTPDMQVRPNTSGTAREIGGLLNTSPLKVEEFVKSTAGGVGSQVLNASDQAQAKLGIIPQNEVGGQSIVQGLTSRFQQASGGKQLGNVFNNVTPKGTQQPGQQAGQGNQNIVANNGKFYVNLGNNTVKGFNTKEEAKDAQLTEQVKTTGQPQTLSTGETVIKTGADKVVKLNLTRGQPGDTSLPALEQEATSDKAAIDLIKNSQLFNSKSLVTQQAAYQLIQSTGGNPAQAYMGAVASLPTPQQSEFVNSYLRDPKNGDLQTRINTLVQGGVLNSTIAAEMNKLGLIDYGTASALRQQIKLVALTQGYGSAAGTGSGGGGTATYAKKMKSQIKSAVTRGHSLNKKIAVKKAKAPKMARLKIKQPKYAQIQVQSTPKATKLAVKKQARFKVRS